MLKDPEIAKRLEQQLSNGENSNPPPQNAPEPPNVSVPTTQRQTPNLQSNTFYELKMLSLLVTCCKILNLSIKMTCSTICL